MDVLIDDLAPRWHTASLQRSSSTLRSSLSRPLGFTLSARTAVAYSGGHGHANAPESPVAKFLIGGLVTIAFETCGGHFLEFLKIAKQTSTDSYLTLTRNITAKKGFIGTLDGFVPWGVMQAVAKGAVFSWGQAQSMSMMRDITWMSREQKTVVSGGLGGLVQGIVLSPLLLLKTRVMTDPAFRGSGGLLETAAASAAVGGRIIAKEGVGVLMKGAGVFSLKRAADWTTRYLFVVMVEEAMRATPDAKLSETQQGLASLAGGSLSALATIPMDVLVATAQSANKAGKKVSVLEVLREQMAAGGIGGSIAFATRGLMARVAHVALTTFMMKTMTSKIYDVLYGPAPAKA